MSSVLQQWVMELPLREQGTLLTAVRGCDVAPKVPLDSHERHLTAWIRCCFMNPADPREVGIEPGAFFQDRPPEFKWSEFGHYPQHWTAHVAHALEVIGYRHPDVRVRGTCAAMYRAYVHSMHLNAELQVQFEARMTEDRIANGTVVS